MTEITNKAPSVVNVEDVIIDHNKIYGFISLNGDAGLITREDFEDGDFYGFILNNLATQNNSYRSMGKPTVKELIRVMLKNDFKVYVFDTPQEFGEWFVSCC